MSHLILPPIRLKPAKPEFFRWLLLLPLLATVIITRLPAGLVLVENGEPRAVVVTADQPGPTARYAAEQLRRYVKKATGAVLPLAVESEVPVEAPVQIYIGDTETARDHGINPEQVDAGARAEIMRPDVRWRKQHPICLVRAVGNKLFIVGNDHVSAGDFRPALPGETDGGTLYGVNELLDRRLGIRWLWPGELGTYVPESTDVVVPAEINVIVTPEFDSRIFRTNHIHNALRSYDPREPRHALSFSEETLRHYKHEMGLYLLRHQARGIGTGQFYGDHSVAGRNMWAHYGQSHPEYFMMHEDGTRGPVGTRRDAALCVSNPELHRLIVDEVWNGGDSLNLGEVDHRASYCRCTDCMSWDEPQPPELTSHSTANRYARFWAAVRDLAVVRNPKVRITVLLYMKYAHAPTIDIDLRGVQGRFCPWGSGIRHYHPISEPEHEYQKATWRGWKNTGMTMGYRPNSFITGHVMPHISTWQAGGMFRFARHNGMAGFDIPFEPHAATRGPMLYIYMRLVNRPEMTVAEIRNEYFSAFGPAAAAVEEYFDYWEQYTRGLPEGGVRYNRIYRTAELYPPRSFAEAAAILTKARQRVRRLDNQEYAERVAFLEAGLEHVRLLAAFIDTLEDHGQAPGSRQQLQAAGQALRELITFRREHEHLFIADFARAAGREARLELAPLLPEP